MAAFRMANWHLSHGARGEGGKGPFCARSLRPATRIGDPNLMYNYKGYKHPARGWAISKEKMEQWGREDGAKESPMHL